MEGWEFYIYSVVFNLMEVADVAEHQVIVFVK